MGRTIYYRELRGYKYGLTRPYEIRVPTGRFTPSAGLVTRAGFVELVPEKEDGRWRDGWSVLKLGKSYAWDGPSGPTFDTPNFMRAALVHDAFYQLMREELLPQEFRKTADKILRMHCLEDGMHAWRAKYIYYSVRVFAGYAARPSKGLVRPELSAP